MSRPNGDILVGDAERETAISELQAHCVAGRLTVEELEMRLGEVSASRTRSQLASSLRDLPSLDLSPARVVVARRPRMPGVLSFTERMVVDTTTTRARDVALTTIAPGLARGGFELTEQSAHTLVFEHRDSLVGAAVALVLFMPLGVLMLLARKRNQSIVFTFTSEGDRTAVTVYGRASRRVRRILFEASQPG